MTLHRRTYIALGMVFALAATACSKIDQAAPPSAVPGAAQPSSPAAKLEAAPAPAPAAATTASSPRRALEVRATFEVTVATNDDAARLATQLARVAGAHGGFVSESTVGAGGPAHVVVRVPSSDIAAVRESLAGSGGAIVREAVQTTDVTDALADLDARLRSAREEEKRLLAIMEQRTGTLNDVLASERALAGVRERIEQLEAQQRVAQGRVDLASVDVWLRARASTAPEGTVTDRLGSSARDGVAAAKEVTLALVSFGLRGGPTALMLAALAWALVATVRRALRFRSSRLSSPA